MRTKKIVIVWLVACFICSLLIGCEQAKIKKNDQNRIIWCVAGVLGYNMDEDVSRQQERLNEVLGEQGFPYQVEIQVIVPTPGGFSKKQLKQIEQSDIITMQNQFNEEGNNVLSTLEESIDAGLFVPLDDMMKTESGETLLENQLLGLALKTGQLDNIQWLLPTATPVLKGSSLMIRKDLWEKAGMMQEDAIPAFDKCDDLFEKLYNANDKKPFLHFSAMQSEGMINGTEILQPEFLTEIQNSSAGLIDPMTAGTAVMVKNGNDEITENFIKTSEFEEIMDSWIRYMEKGYVSIEPVSEVPVKMQNSISIEMQQFTIDEQQYVVPKAQNYVCYTSMLTARPIKPFMGICSKSDKKEEAFSVIVNAIKYQINHVVGEEEVKSGYNMCFYSGMSEDMEKEFFEIANVSPKFVSQYPLPTLDIPEIQAVNRVFKKYCIEDGEEVMERYFSKEEDWLGELRDRLENAGIEKILQELNSRS